MVVEGSLSPLETLRNEMVQVEDRFFERYNALNTNHDFDVHCDMERASGTNIKHRHCRMATRSRRSAREGRDYLEAMKNMDDGAVP